MQRHHRRIVAGIVLMFVLAAAAPAAARFDLNPPPASTATNALTVPEHPSNMIPTPGGYVLRHVTVARGANTVNTTMSRRSPSNAVHVVPANSGFHWGDAGIGAGSAFAAALLLAGGVLCTTHLRRRAAGDSAEQAV